MQACAESPGSKFVCVFCLLVCLFAGVLVFCLFAVCWLLLFLTMVNDKSCDVSTQLHHESICMQILRTKMELIYPGVKLLATPAPPEPRAEKWVLMSIQTECEKWR